MKQRHSSFTYYLSSSEKKKTYVQHISHIFGGFDWVIFALGECLEASDSRAMHIAAKEADTNILLLSEAL